MEQFNNFSGKYNDIFNNQFDFIYNNEYILGFLILCTLLYLIVAKNQLPDYVNKLLHNEFFMFAVITFSLFKVNKNLHTSVLLTLFFLGVMKLLNSNKKENFCYDGITKDNEQNKYYCNLTDANKKTAQCDYCPDKK